MKKNLACTSLMFCLSLMLSAQQLDPKKVNTSGQKDIKQGQLKTLPPPPAKVSFSAIIAEQRSALPSYEDKNTIARFTQVQWNEGNGFDAANGVFTAPAQGVYCFIGNFSIAKYGCVGNQVTFSVTLIKNTTQILEKFNLPVAAGSIDTWTTENIMLMVQLNANDKISLRPDAVVCTGGELPMLHRVIFSGYKVN